MTYRSILTEEAKAELDHEIAYSKERWGAKQATVYKRELLEQLRKIVRNPMLYPLNPDLGDGLRFVHHKGNYIIYALDEEKKLVLIGGCAEFCVNGVSFKPISSVLQTGL